MELFTRDPSKVISFPKFISGQIVLDLGHLQNDNKTKNVVVLIILDLYFADMLPSAKETIRGN